MNLWPSDLPAHLQKHIKALTQNKPIDCPPPFSVGYRTVGNSGQTWMAGSTTWTTSTIGQPGTAPSVLWVTSCLFVSVLHYSTSKQVRVRTYCVVSKIIRLFILSNNISISRAAGPSKPHFIVSVVVFNIQIHFSQCESNYCRRQVCWVNFPCLLGQRDAAACQWIPLFRNRITFLATLIQWFTCHSVHVEMRSWKFMHSVPRWFKGPSILLTLH